MSPTSRSRRPSQRKFVFGFDQPVQLIRPHKFPWLHSRDLFNGKLTCFCGNPTDNGINCLSDKLTDRCVAPLSLSRESPLLLGRDQYLKALCEHAHIIHMLLRLASAVLAQKPRRRVRREESVAQEKPRI